MAGRYHPDQDEAGWKTMKDNTVIPRFTDPPDKYDSRYFANMNLQLYQFLVEMMSQGPTAVGEFRIDPNIPTSSAGLEEGRVFVDNGNTLKIVLTVDSTASATGTGTVTGIGSSTAASTASATGTGTASGVGDTA